MTRPRDFDGQRALARARRVWETGFEATKMALSGLRALRDDDDTKVVLLLSSDAASFVTGAEHTVDGGMTETRARRKVGWSSPTGGAADLAVLFTFGSRRAATIRRAGPLAFRRVQLAAAGQLRQAAVEIESMSPSGQLPPFSATRVAVVLARDGRDAGGGRRPLSFRARKTSREAKTIR